MLQQIRAKKRVWDSCCVDTVDDFILFNSYSLLLQHVRLLSRKQFQLRALMQKARKTAGLSDLYWPTPTTWKSFISSSPLTLFILSFIPFFLLLIDSCLHFNLYNICSRATEIWAAATVSHKTFWPLLFSTVMFPTVWLSSYFDQTKYSFEVLMR